jgi:hypothetical protein
MWGGAYTERSRIYLQLRMHILRVVPSKWTLFVQTAEVNLCDDHVAKSRLARAPSLALDSISEKTLLADNAHVDQSAMHTGRQKFVAQAGQSRRPGSAEHVRSNSEIESIDQTTFQQRPEQSWTAFARDRANLVFVAQSVQHSGKINMLCFAEMERRLFSQGFLIFPRHSPCGKNKDRRDVRLKNVQTILDLPFVGDNHANRIRRLPAFHSCLA